MLSHLFETAVSALFLSLIVVGFRKLFPNKSSTDTHEPCNCTQQQHPAPNTKINDYMLIVCAVIGTICLIGYFLTK